MLCFRRSEHKSCAKRASPSSSGGPLTCQQTNGGDVDTHDCSRATRNRCSKRLPSYFVDQGWELSTPSCVRTTHDLALLEHPKGVSPEESFASVHESSSFLRTTAECFNVMVYFYPSERQATSHRTSASQERTSDIHICKGIFGHKIQEGRLVWIV